MFIEISLQVLVTECVALLMLSVALALQLQTLIGQVNVVVLVLQVVFGGARAQVAMFVDVNAEVISHHRPDSDIELPAVEQIWMLYILLDNP